MRYILFEFITQVSLYFLFDVMTASLQAGSGLHSNGMSGTNVASAAGMMSGAFFVGKNQLLEWVNSILDLGVAKVENCASGEGEL